MEQTTIVKELLFQFCAHGKLKRFHQLFTTTNETVSKVKLNIMTNSKGQTLLYVSCKNGHYKMSIHLLENGADPNQRSLDGSTPTHAAARSGCSNLLKYIVEVGGGDLRLHDSNSMTVADWLLLIDKQKSKKSLQMLDKWQHITQCSLSNLNLLSDKSSIFFPQQNNLALKSHGYGDFLTSKQGVEKISTMALCSTIPLASSNDITVDYKCTWAYKAPPGFSMRTASWKGLDVTVKNRKHGEILNEDLLLTEINACSQLRHPNILLLLSVCMKSSFEKTAFKACSILIYERISLGSLYYLLHTLEGKNSNDLTSLNFMNFMLQAAEALTFLHEQNLVHRALSSYAIHVIDAETAKLGDFICIAHEDNANYLHEDVKASLARWMAPFSIDSKLFNRNFDVYSFCLVVAECLTGKLPFSSVDVTSIHENKLVYIVPMEIPNELRNILHKGICSYKNIKYFFRIPDLSVVLRRLIKQTSNDILPLEQPRKLENKPLESSINQNSGLDVPDSVAILPQRRDSDFLELPFNTELQSNANETGDTSVFMTTCDNTLTTKAGVLIDETLPCYDQLVTNSSTYKPQVKISEQAVIDNKTEVDNEQIKCKDPKETVNVIDLTKKSLPRSVSAPLKHPTPKGRPNKKVKMLTKSSASFKGRTLTSQKDSPLCFQVQRVQSLLSEISTIFSQHSQTDEENNFIPVSPPNSEFVPNCFQNCSTTESLKKNGSEKNQIKSDAPNVQDSEDVIDGCKPKTSNQLFKSIPLNGGDRDKAEISSSSQSVISERRFSIGSEDLEDIFGDFAERHSSKSQQTSYSENYETMDTHLNSTKHEDKKSVNNSENEPSIEVHYTCLRITDPLIGKYQVPVCSTGSTATISANHKKSLVHSMINNNDVDGRQYVGKANDIEWRAEAETAANDFKINQEFFQKNAANTKCDTEETSLTISPPSNFVTCIEDSIVREKTTQLTNLANITESPQAKEDVHNASCQTNVTFSMGEVHNDPELKVNKQKPQLDVTPNAPMKVDNNPAVMNTLKKYYHNKAKFYPQTPSKWSFQKKLQLFKNIDGEKPEPNVQVSDICLTTKPHPRALNLDTNHDSEQPITPVMSRVCSLLSHNKGVKTSTPVSRSNAILQQHDKLALKELQQNMEFTISTVQDDTDNPQHKSQVNDFSYKLEIDENEGIPKIRIFSSDNNGDKTSSDEAKYTSDTVPPKSTTQSHDMQCSNEHTSATTSSGTEDSENYRQEDFSEVWSMCFDTSGTLLDALVDDLAGSIANSIIREEVAALTSNDTNVAVTCK